MEIIELTIEVTGDDVRRFFAEYGMVCTEVSVQVSSRTFFNKVVVSTEKKIITTHPHTLASVDAREAMIDILGKRAAKLLLEKPDKMEVFTYFTRNNGILY